MTRSQHSRGIKKIKHEQRTGKPISLSTTENIYVIHDMLLEDQRIGLKRI
jgi:hypothetical protein